MGVPSFYRWLVRKYPKIVVDAVEDDDEEWRRRSTGVDNFYLDMNGIIHPCFHPDDDDDDSRPAPTSFDQVLSRMYEYIDRLFNIVRPRKLLFMAIDGVAPRAKMNQQRGRRFRAAKDALMAGEMEDVVRKELEKQGKAVLPKQESHELADSNVITPGTVFMHLLSDKLRTYITQRIKHNPAWTNIKVILSDDNVPGEGEHKIMSFIRSQRSLPGYHPDTTHCLYGLDADLIMLALATHEIHFSILREEVLSPSSHEITPARSSAHSSLKSRGWFKENSSSCTESVIEIEKLKISKEAPSSVGKKQNYQFLNVWVLREYLGLDMKIPSSEKIEFDLERIIDDFIFICFFAGNDFLPHMPGLELHEGCINLLMHVYKEKFQDLGGYLVNTQKLEDKKGGYIKLKRVENFILAVGAFEEKIFSKRTHLRERNLKRILSEYRDAKNDEMNQLDEGTSSDIVASYDVSKESEISASAVDVDSVLSNTKELKKKLKDYLKGQSDLFKDGGVRTDKVKFGTPGWKERYYKEKFSAESRDEIEATRKDVVAKYGEGLCWVLLYYFSGVPSWTWFYPYHYGPVPSDMKGLSQAKVKFQKGLPFKPFDQLMGVLPPASAHALPVAYKQLMTDDSSNIIDFYPTEFETDTDGKRFIWQGIPKLPFIEEGRLLTETRKLENELKDHEKARNLQSLDRLFVRCTSKESLQVTGAASKRIEGAIMMDSTIEGIKGTIHLMPHELVKADEDDVLCMFYEINQGFQYIPRPLEGVKIPEKTVDDGDIVEMSLWHEDHRSSSSSNANTRFFQNPRQMNPGPTFTPKLAGRGFSLGRGKVSGYPTVRGEQSYNSTRGHQPSLSRSDVYNWRSQGGGDRECLRKPEPNTNHRPVLNDTPPARNFLTYDRSGDWRSNKLVRAAPPVESSVPSHNPNTGRGRGRGWIGTKS